MTTIPSHIPPRLGEAMPFTVCPLCHIDRLACTSDYLRYEPLVSQYPLLAYHCDTAMSLLRWCIRWCGVAGGWYAEWFADADGDERVQEVAA